MTNISNLTERKENKLRGKMETINNREVRDDKVEFLMQIWKEKLKQFNEDKLRRNAAMPLAEDILNYQFDFESNEMKFEVLGNKFADIANTIKDDEISACVDVYYIQENIIKMFDMESREQEAFSMIFESNVERTRDISLLNEFLSARHILRNLKDIDSFLIEKIFQDLNFKNIRNFMDGVIKHKTFPVELPENFNVTEIIVYRCVKERLIFLLDLLLERVKIYENEKIKQILKYTDGAGNNIFHLTCDSRIKFLLEELFSLMQRAFGENSKDLADYLLTKNLDDLNGFQLAFDMPLKYTALDYANEIKNKETLFGYYRNRGPIELEMYNFESCLNFLYDIARRNIPDKVKRTFILNKSSAKSKKNFYHNYMYSNEFSGFRHDFLQLRYHCITKLSCMKTEDYQKTANVYQFLSHYVEKFMSTLNEYELMELYTKLSYDTFMEDFFKILVKNYYTQALKIIRDVKNLNILFTITSKTLGDKEFKNVLMTKGFNGNSTLHWAINTNDYEIVQLTIGQIKEKSEIVKWILMRNNEKSNALYLTIANKEPQILQLLLEFFDNNLEEKAIFDVLEQTARGNYKFFDTCVLIYSYSIFNLIWSFIDTHISRENQKHLIGEQIVSLGTARWQDNATCSVLDLISNLFDGDAINQLLSYKNFEGQTPFHEASKRTNLSHLQLLCKFAHAFLTKDDFLALISHADCNGESM